MKAGIILTIALLGTLASGPAAQAAADIRTITIDSPSNQRKVPFAIYLPPGYDRDSARRYPVVYCLHGIGGNAVNRANSVAPALEAAIVSGKVIPMIFVFPDGQNNSFYGDAFDGHKQVYSNIIKEIIPYVDKNYRTRADRKFRAIEGFSMGGYGAAMLGAKHPELFSAIVEYGGALADWQWLVPAVKQEMYNNIQANFGPYSLWELSKANAEALRTRVAYLMVVGDQDSQYRSNVRFRDYLKTLNVNPEFVVLPGIAHDGRAYANDGTGFRFLSAHFQKSLEK